MPRWVYRSLFVVSDHLLHDIDMMAREFVTTAKGVERRHHALHFTDPVCQGGTGLHQIYWAFRCRYITLLQTALRDRHGRVRAIAQRPVDRKMAPIRDYVTMLRQLGARTSIQLCEYQAPRGGPTFFDEESSDDGIQMRSQHPDVGDESLSRKYIATECTRPIPAEGEVPPGFTKCVVAGHEAYTNNKARGGSEWHSDGSKLTSHTDHGDYSRARCSLTCGPLIIIARITGPQTSYRAELQPPAMLTQLRDAGDTLTLDNQAVVRWCQTEPHRECADRDLRDFIYTHTQGNPIPMRWIPGHRELTMASTKQDREDIRRNNEVDRWAKKAAGLPLPDIDPTDVSHVVTGGGHAPTPARKWILGCRNILGFRDAHWTTRLPLKGTRRRLWHTWLWGNVRWEACGAP